MMALLFERHYHTGVGHGELPLDHRNYGVVSWKRIISFHPWKALVLLLRWICRLQRPCGPGVVMPARHDDLGVGFGMR